MEMAAGQSEIHSNEESPSSIVTVTTPPSTFKRSPYQTLVERKLKDTCFRCGKQGHWAQDCLSLSSSQSIKASPQSSTPPPPPPPPTLDVHQLPVLRCQCGVFLTICVSRSEANYGRRYYGRNCNCNVKSTQGGNFYKWCDDVKAPMCRCGAGACTINIQRDENGKDTKYYTCRIRTGHGSCGFLQFDSPPNPPNSWPRSTKIDERPSVLSPQHGGLPNIMTHENGCSISSFPNNIVVRETEICKIVTGKGCRVSRLTSRSYIRSRQIEFWNQMSAAGNPPNGCKILQIMGLHVHGWVGRLAFPPSRTLPDPPIEHFFCCIYPLFDPILVSEQADVSDSRSSSITPHVSSNAEVYELSQNALRNDTQRWGFPSGTLSLKRSFTAIQEGVTNPILKEVRSNLQTDLLTHLESMDHPPDYNTVLHAVNDTFNALGNTLIECGPFAEHLVEFSPYTPMVAGLEATLQDNSNQHVPSIPKNIEKHSYVIAGIYAEALATLTASSHYLQSAREAASHFKDMICQIEKLETFLLNTAKNLGQSKRSMEATYQELTKAFKLPQDKEEQMRCNQDRH